ncbi:MAG: aminoacetone oxidase family FAD-binding enzyme [Acidobacteria bacterium]|nr:aminoacetone oxidase family FAD-binding enzyme [Acidobacteriota bacterium]
MSRAAPPLDRVDVAVIGAGAAGLMAAIQAGRSGSVGTARRIVLLESARRPGAKILVAGGGRCNVTHHAVDERDFAGSTPAAIRKVLRRFDVPATIEFFREIGVEMKREETGKLFPVTDDAATVLEALLRAAGEAGAELRAGCRVENVRREGDAFRITGAWGAIEAARVVLSTGGRSLPKSGSDGHGFEIARSLGHSVTDVVTPALVPLTLRSGHFVTRLPGLATDATLTLRGGTGRTMVSVTGPALCTHFGLSGPAVLDISRHYLHAIAEDPAATISVSWLPGETAESIDAALMGLAASSAGRFLSARLPERLARALCDDAGVDPSAPGRAMTRERRRALAGAVTATPLPITGDRGYTHAEATAGGVPLAELKLDTMESRICPGLHLCGEICDVDGRIGGFNFQWAWSSGYVAGIAVAPSPVAGAR